MFKSFPKVSKATGVRNVISASLNKTMKTIETWKKRNNLAFAVVTLAELSILVNTFLKSVAAILQALAKSEIQVKLRNKYVTNVILQRSF